MWILKLEDYLKINAAVTVLVKIQWIKIKQCNFEKMQFATFDKYFILLYSSDIYGKNSFAEVYATCKLQYFYISLILLIEI